jgi:hypothetical protein
VTVGGAEFDFWPPTRTHRPIRRCVPFSHGFPLHRHPDCVVRVERKTDAPVFATVETVTSPRCLRDDKAKPTFVRYDGRLWRVTRSGAKKIDET